MNKQVKRILLSGCLILGTQFMQAQEKASNIWDNLSIEGQYGMNSALSPNEGVTTSDYSGFNFFQVGLTYHINDVWGVRGTFSSSDFKHKDVDNLGVNYSKLMLEATYNVLTAINQGKSSSDFEVTAHAGFGLGSGKSESVSGNDMIAATQIGLMPKYNFSPRVAVFLDGTFVNQFSQDYGFNGVAVKQGSGSYLNVGLGVQVRLGQ